jgi:hypothetical protein
MKLNLDMAKKRLDCHTLATQFLVASNGIVLLQMKLNPRYEKEAVGLTHAGHSVLSCI